MAVKHTVAVLSVTLLLFGCQAMDPANWPAAPEGGRVVSGKPSAVYERVSDAFREAGVSGGACGASIDAHGENMTVHGATSDGRRFTVNLQQDGPNATRIGITWAGEPDDALGRKILAGLARK